MAGSSEPATEVARPDVLSIGGLYDQVEAALTSAFPRRRQLWVRGEIQSFSDSRSGHCYMDLIDPDDGEGIRGHAARGGVPALKVKCWRGTWAPLSNSLRKAGIELSEGMVVVLRGSINLYRPKGEIDFILSELDVTALLGRLAAQRAALLQKLESEGLLRRNAALPVPDVVLRVGLVASPGTEGYRDFLGQLQGSGFGFEVQTARVTVQGADAPAAVARAVTKLGLSDCDLIVVVRGGGSRADLAPFDSELVARAIATSPKPIWTGIGHTGDESVADIVANRACITPTECGQELVRHVAQWWQSNVAEPAALLARRVPSLLSEAEGRDRAARSRLIHATRSQLRVHRERLVGRAVVVAQRAPERLTARRHALNGQAVRLGPLSTGHLAREAERVRSWQRLLTAYDVDRQLERGYTLTFNEDGRLLRSASTAPAGSRIVTRFADGTTHARVESSDVRTDEQRNEET